MDPIIVGYSFDSPLEKVWDALSREDELKKWYFPVENYKFETGNEFTFYESEDSKNYFHKCRFLNIVPKKLIEYSWSHPSHSKGISTVKWEISEDGGKTKVTLSHSGVENFADGGEVFARSNFEMGWNAIVKNMLRNHLYGIKKVVFDIEINNSAAKIWPILWGKDSYTAWTQPFCEGSYYEGELANGKRVHFLSPSGEGMYSDVAFFKEHEILIFKHIGMVKDKKELPVDAETEKWTGTFESYKLKEKDGKTNLKVEVDVVDAYSDYMNKTFPLALKKLKALSEAN